MNRHLLLFVAVFFSVNIVVQQVSLLLALTDRPILLSN